MKAIVTLILGIMIAVSTGAQVRNQGTTSTRSNERTSSSTHTNTRHANENGNRNNHSTQTNTNQGTTSKVNNVGTVTNQSVKPSGEILKDAQLVRPTNNNNSHSNNNNNQNHNHNNSGYNGGGNNGDRPHDNGHNHNNNNGYHPNNNSGYKPHSPAGAPMNNHHSVNPYAHYGYSFRPATVSLRSYYVTRPATTTTTLILSIYGLSDIDAQRLSIGLPTRFNVVNEYGMFERRYASHADLQLAIRAIGTDYRGRTEYILELLDLHDLSMIATWGVDNFFSDPMWNIERCLDSNRYDIQRIITEWDRFHYY